MNRSTHLDGSLTLSDGDKGTGQLVLDETEQGLVVTITNSVGTAFASAKWGQHAMNGLAKFLSDPDQGGNYATVWNGRIPAGALSVGQEGAVSLTLLSEGFGTIVLDVDGTDTLRKVLTGEPVKTAA